MQSMDPRQQPAPRWRTSSYSGANGSCVEVAGLADGRWAVRDTKDRTRPALTFTPDAWSTFLDAVRDGSIVPDRRGRPTS